MSTPDRASAGAAARRLGLFALYLACYVGFMLLAAFRQPLMAWVPFGGVNLAVLYGFGLIVLAFALAVLYWWLSRGTGAAR